jgi:hypothetical protein
MVGPPRVEFRVQRPLIVEIAVPAIDWQNRRWNGDKDPAWPALNRLVPRPRGNDDHLVTEPGGRAQLRIDVGADAPAVRCIESANVDDPHGADKPAGRMKLK